jgi:7-carboxy-7-deazaguanine synthase
VKRRLQYAVKEVFLTIQGEGTHAGSRAVFVRFSGCNVWTGREQDREKDTPKGCCAAWCDTLFRGTDGVNGGKYTGPELAKLTRTIWNATGEALVVCTGGEPSLQLDEALVKDFHFLDQRVHVETNGSGLLPANVDWATLSPKPPMQVIDQRYDEVKVVVPAVDPSPWERFASRHFVQPLDDKDARINSRNVQAAIDFVMKNPAWKMGSQMHKQWGLP